MINEYDNIHLEAYASALARVASLSNLFSESRTPYIHYRVTEYLYARTLEADNLARSDIAIDAKRNNVGIGLKTFTYSNRPKFEKIAEFNKEVTSFDTLGPLEKVRRVAELRNDRIDFAGRLASVDMFIYHCVARLPGKLFVFEQPMPHINIANVTVTTVSGRNISFNDGDDKYRFSSSKSTLYKEFYSADCIFEKPVKIYDDPYALLASMGLEELPTEFGANSKSIASENRIVLPLYGYHESKPYVFDRSGLNQWNARGRQRSYDEVYIPIPAKAREKSLGFLPPRDQHFELHFPSGDKMTVKVCQDGGKALMSQSNAELGQWLLRDKLGLKDGEILTYEKLLELGVDSVEISKVHEKYYVDFKKIGAYEEFLNG